MYRHGDEDVSVELHIEELVVDGFGRGDGELLRLALAAELETLTAAAGSPRPGDHESIDAGAVRVRHGSGPDQLGRALARSIHAGVWGGGQRR